MHGSLIGWFALQGNLGDQTVEMTSFDNVGNLAGSALWWAMTKILTLQEVLVRIYGVLFVRVVVPFSFSVGDLRNGG